MKVKLSETFFCGSMLVPEWLGTIAATSVICETSVKPRWYHFGCCCVNFLSDHHQTNNKLDQNWITDFTGGL